MIKDSTGRKVKIKKEPKKVVALSASLSDVWLLSGGELCGATADVLEEEVVHENLNKKKIKNVGSVEHPDLDVIFSLKPDLVLISGNIEEQMDTAETLKKEDIPYYIVRMNTLDDFLTVLKQMTEVTGEEDNYEEYGEKAREEADYLLKQVPKGKENDCTGAQSLFCRHQGKDRGKCRLQYPAGHRSKKCSGGKATQIFRKIKLLHWRPYQRVIRIIFLSQPWETESLP